MNSRLSIGGQIDRKSTENGLEKMDTTEHLAHTAQVIDTPWVVRSSPEIITEEMDTRNMKLRDHTRAETTFTLQVNFEKIDAIIESEPKICHLPWVLKIMTEIANVKELGFYLECKGPIDSSWTCFVTAKLSIVPQKEGVENSVRKLEHTFCPSRNTSGHRHFILWEEFIDPKRGFKKDHVAIF